MLKKLGMERYGVWALVALFSAFVQLSDFGIGYALVKFVAELKAQNDYKRLNTVLKTALILYGVISLVVGLVLILASGTAISALHIPDPLIREARVVFRGSILLFCVNILIGIFSSIVNGIQRIDLTNAILFFSGLVNAAGVLIVLYSGAGLTGLLINNAVTLMFVGLANGWVVKKYAPQVRILKGEFDKTEAKKILTYGANIQITNIAGIAGDPLIRFAFSYLSGVSAVSYYDIAVKLVNPIRGLFGQAVAPIMPFSAERYLLDGSDAIARVYKKSLRYLILFALPIMSFAFVMGPAFIVLWLGDGYELSALTFRILMVGQFASIVSFPSYYIFLSTHIRYTTYMAVVNGLLNVVMFAVLGTLFGYKGILTGFTIVMLILSLYGIRLLGKVFRIPARDLIGTVPTTSVLFIALLTLGMAFLITAWGHMGLVKMIALGSGYFSLYLGFLWLSKALTIIEVRRLVRAVLPGRNVCGFRDDRP